MEPLNPPETDCLKGKKEITRTKKSASLEEDFNCHESASHRHCQKIPAVSAIHQEFKKVATLL